MGEPGPTILERLNVDCWRAVLDQLDIDDIVRSERVSRAWRDLVRDYLPGVRRFKIQRDSEIDNCVLLGKCGDFGSYRRLTVRSNKTEMLKRIGPYAESLLWGNADRSDFTDMEQYCPKLEQLTFVCTTDYVLPLEKMMHCKQLRRVVFEGFQRLHDAHLAHILRNEAIEELVINGSCVLLSGLFLSQLRSTNLKSILLYHCSALELVFLFSAADYLVGLKRLDLCHLSKCSSQFSEVCWLLERLPGLEHLALDGYARTPLRSEFVDTVSCLPNLRHLSFIINENVDDEWIEDVVRACAGLRSLNLQFCNGVSGRGLVALCRARPTLSKLIVTFIDATDDELAACIEACHGLTLLDVSACPRVTPRLVALAAAATRARARRLTLRVHHTGITREQEHDRAPGPTILERLNADCWRAVLDRLDIDDIVRSERVSRAWQKRVRDYLEGVRSFRIGYVTFGVNKMDQSGRYTGYRRIKLNENKYILQYKGMFEKMGPYIKSMASDSINEHWLRVIPQTCKNLQDIVFFRISTSLPIHLLASCKQLQRLTFDSCSGLREYFLNFLISREESIEELIINNFDHGFGYFLMNFQPKKLRTLHLNKCPFKIKYMLAALSNLTALENLELNDNPPETLKKLHLCLERLPKLEHLSLNGYEKVEMGDEMIAALGGLSRLKHLSLKGNRNVDDAWLAAVASGCRELRVLDIGDCKDVSGRTIAALATALAPTLAGLRLRGNPDVTNADLAACINHCRSLTWLDMSGCARVSAEVLRVAGGGRRARPLRLRMSCAVAQHEQVQLAGAGLALEWDDAPAPRDYYSDSEEEHRNRSGYYVYSYCPTEHEPHMNFLES